MRRLKPQPSCNTELRRTPSQHIYVNQWVVEEKQETKRMAMEFWSKQNELNEVSRNDATNTLKDEQEVQGALPRMPSVSSDDSMYWEVPVRVFILEVCANMLITGCILLTYLQDGPEITSWPMPDSSTIPPRANTKEVKSLCYHLVYHMHAMTLNSLYAGSC